MDSSKLVGIRITKMKVAGRSVKHEKIYRVAVGSFVAKGGEGYRMLLDGKRIVDANTGHLLTTAVIEYVRKRTPQAHSASTLRWFRSSSGGSSPNEPGAQLDVRRPTGSRSPARPTPGAICSSSRSARPCAGGRGGGVHRPLEPDHDARDPGRDNRPPVRRPRLLGCDSG